MSRLPVVSGRDVVKTLGKAVFAATRQKGSHVRLEKIASDGKEIKITVPTHATLKRGTLSK